MFLVQQIFYLGSHDSGHNIFHSKCLNLTDLGSNSTHNLGYIVAALGAALSIQSMFGGDSPTVVHILIFECLR